MAKWQKGFVLNCGGQELKKLVSVFIIVVSFTITFSGCNIINYSKSSDDGSLVRMKPISYTENAHYGDGKHFKEARALYSVETTEQSYFLYLDFYPSNTVEPAKEGLHTILLLDHRAEKDYNQYAGIYHPEWDKEVR